MWVWGQRKMSQVLGAFGLLDFTMLRPVITWQAFWNLWTVYFFNFLIFFHAAGNREYWIDGYGGTTALMKNYTLVILVWLDRWVSKIWCYFAALLSKSAASSFGRSIEYLDTVPASSETPATRISSTSPVRMSLKSDTLDQLSTEEEKLSSSGKSWCSKAMCLCSYDVVSKIFRTIVAIYTAVVGARSTGPNRPNCEFWVLLRCFAANTW
jgi:hypothetical protein